MAAVLPGHDQLSSREDTGPFLQIKDYIQLTFHENPFLVTKTHRIILESLLAYLLAQLHDVIQL